MFVKTEFYLFREIFLRKRKPKNSYLFFLDFGRNLFEIPANYLGASVSELPCKCPDESFVKKVLHNFFSSVMMSRKNLDLWHKKTAGLLKLHSTSTQERFEERSWHVLVFFGAWMDFFLQIPAKNLGQICRNSIVGGQRNLLHKTSVSGKAKSLSCFWFRNFSVRSLVYRQKNIGNLSFVKSEFHPFIGIIWWQKTVKFVVRFFRFSAETFQNSS